VIYLKETYLPPTIEVIVFEDREVQMTSSSQDFGVGDWFGE
jgi:hypothetical protein